MSENNDPQPQRGPIGRLFTNTSVYALGDVAIKLTTAFFAPILSQLLAPEQYGIWSLAVMVFTGLGFIYNPALHGAVTRFYFDHEDDEAARRRFQGTISTFLLIWGAFLSMLLLFFGDVLFEALFEDFPYDPYGELVTWMAFLTVLGVVPKAAWVAAEKPKAFIGVSMLASGVNVFGALALIGLAGMDVLGLFWARLLSLIIVGWPFLHYLVKRVGFSFDLKALLGALRFSLPLVPHLMAHWVLAMSDRFILERGLGAAAVGIYGIAYAFTEAINTVANAMNRAWVPIFTRHYEDEDKHALIGQTITYFMLAVGGAAAALAILGPTIIRTPFLINERYVEAASFVSILAIGGLFQGLYYIFVSGLFYFKRNTVIPIITVIAGLINLILNLYWIPLWGMRGAALATLVGYMVLSAGVWYACRRITKLPIERRRLLKFVVIAATLTGAGMGIDGMLPLGWEWAAKAALIVLGPVVLVLLGFFTKDEMGWFKRKIGRG